MKMREREKLRQATGERKRAGKKQEYTGQEEWDSQQESETGKRETQNSMISRDWSSKPNPNRAISSIQPIPKPTSQFIWMDKQNKSAISVV